MLNGSGVEPEQTAALILQAVHHVRAGNGPCLLRMVVPRLSGHTYGEDQAVYKTARQLEEEQQQDPVSKLKIFLEGRLNWSALEDEVRENVRTARLAAEEMPEPSPAQITRFVFADTGEHVGSSDPPEEDQGRESLLMEPVTSGPRVNFVDAIRRVMEFELEANPKLMIFGEDVGARGGVHRATADLQRRFGKERVFDTSLSEEAIVGRATGMALAGLNPLAEIQFRKYADPATEQIQDLGWLRWRTANKFSAPVVIRIPVGFSKKTGDPWHSVCGEAIFAHLVGWRIAFPSNAADAAGLLRGALRGHDPTIFLEHRALLDGAEGRRPYPGDEYLIPFGRASIVSRGDWLTVVTWGQMVYRCLEAARPFGRDVEVVDLRTIIPWDKEAVLASVRKTGKCLLVHEDNITGGFAGEVIAVVVEEAFSALDAPIGRVASADCPIPYNARLMEAVVPGEEQIRKKIDELLNW